MLGGLLDRLLGKKPPPAAPGAATPEQFMMPVGLDEAHSFVEPGPEEYAPKPTYGANPFAPKVGTDLPAIRHQDTIMIHRIGPEPDRHPSGYYEDRNSANILRSRYNELNQSVPWQESTAAIGDVYQPWEHTPRSPRPTSTQSPSTHRFVRPFDQRFEKRLSGESGSAAVLGRAYPVGGMTAMPSWRNTVRIMPPARDTENMDLPATRTAAVTPSVYVSPQAPAERRWGL
ncbi:hypothetical protein ACWCPQ_34290 [Nocardia sp. NPDC001965]